MTTAVVLSAGAWSRTAHLPTLVADPQVRLLAVTSPRRATAEDLAGEFGATHAFTEWEQALELRPEVVVVAGPPVSHVDQVSAALSAGAHVLVEKPFALDGAGADAMCAAAAAVDRDLLVGFGWSCTPVFRRARQLVADGELGQLEHVSVHLAVNTRALLQGGRDGGWAGASTSEPPTYTDPAVSGGGSAAVTMSHQLGLISWITGQPVDRIAAVTEPRTTRTELHAGAILRFAEQGSGVLSSASTHPDPREPQWRFSLYGSAGQLDIDTARGSSRWTDRSGRVEGFASEHAACGYDGGAPTRALLDRARGLPVPAGLAGSLGRHVVKVTDALYSSAATGALVVVDD